MWKDMARKEKEIQSDTDLDSEMVERERQDMFDKI